MSKYGVFFRPYFPVFGLKKEIYSVNLSIQSKYRKMRTRKNCVSGHFSRSVWPDDFMENKWHSRFVGAKVMLNLNNR